MAFSEPPQKPALPDVQAYAHEPFARDYEVRREAYLQFHADNPGEGPYAETARILLGREPDEGCIRRALKKMDMREDCADFRLNGILRLLYQAGDREELSEELRARTKETILGFKYWPEEPGIDSMCYWSENHFILYAGGGYLAGQLLPDQTFTNSGQTGREKMAVCRPRILRWLDLRYRLGFSEWLSNTYYVHDLAPLLNLVDFCKDEEITQRASIVVDLLLADMALNSFRGAFGSTHGRAYGASKKWASRESTASVAKVAFGMNTCRLGVSGALALALSQKYRMPQVLYEIAADVDRPAMVNRQRAGYRIEEAGRWGLDTERLEDGMTFLCLEAHAHPEMVNLTMRMLDEYRFWENDFFKAFKQHRQLLEAAHQQGNLPSFVRAYERDVTRTMLEEVNIYTYRTPDYMLSTAQDYRKGFGGSQQHIWQATLGPDTTCFTTHPVGSEDYSPTEWTGSGSLPRAAQIENVVIALYDIFTSQGMYVTHDLLLTHAWLPKDKFDEVEERNGWVFARRGDGYLALWSQQPAHWQTQPGEDKGRELIAPGKKNIWICELGRRAKDGEFSRFVERIDAAPIRTDGLSVTYESPSQGRLEFSWQGDLLKNGEPVPMRDYARFDNPYGHAPFPGDDMRLTCNGEWLHLDWSASAREASSFAGRQ